MIGLFWIATSNFVIPVLLSITQVILLTRDKDFLKGIIILVINDYVGIIGVLFATVWVSSNHWAESITREQLPTHGKNRDHEGPTVTTINFADAAGQSIWSAGGEDRVVHMEEVSGPSKT